MGWDKARGPIGWGPPPHPPEYSPEYVVMQRAGEIEWIIHYLETYPESRHPDWREHYRVRLGKLLESK